MIFLLKDTTKTGYEWTLVGGHVEGMESLKQALKRETMEEAGVIVKEEDLHFQYIIDRCLNHEKHKIHFFFQVNNWEGEPFNKESSIHLAGEWFPLNKLPKNLGPLATRAIDALKNGKIYDEYGFN